MSEEMMKKIPVILDTDIGSDIDDTWAIAMMLNSPELDVKLIVTANGNTEYRARIVAKLLEAAGRTDIPVGLGRRLSDAEEAQQPWVRGYDLAQYSGRVYRDGVGAAIDLIMGYHEPVTLIAIGPLMNVAEALEREPRITEHARFIGMHGSVRKGYGSSPDPVAEYNVAVDAASCRTVFAAPWPVTITPLDTCGLIKLAGEKYRQVFLNQSPLARAVMENYRIWDAAYSGSKFSEGYGKESTILFDTVAIYLAFSEALVEVEELGIAVTEDGRTVIHPAAKPVRCATGWKDLSRFEDLLVERVIRV